MQVNRLNAALVVAGTVIGIWALTQLRGPADLKPARKPWIEALEAQYGEQREILFRQAKEEFLEGRPAESVRILQPYEKILDSEAKALYSLAQSQAPIAAPVQTPNVVAPPERCENNLDCWAEKHTVNAWVKCQKAVERLARYQFEWTNGFLGMKFDRYVKGVSTPTAVIWVGTSIKFQNGFGAWRAMKYGCEYEASTDTVLNVNALPLND